MKSRHMSIRGVVTMFGGLILGFTVALFLRQNLLPVQSRRCHMNFVRDVRPSTLSKELNSRHLIFIGVMTAEKFLDSRAKAVYETWGRKVPGKLEFFSSGTSQTKMELPVVSLPGVDDSYPPQRKSMMMLKYMHDNYIDQYEWFMRSDDDVYIRTEKLASFLWSLNSSQDIYLGQAGTGAKDEKGLLGLGSGDNFCMGGPGVIISRSVLKKVVPHIEYCLKHLLTSHEDVEVGRCIKRFVGIPCTWSFEMQALFYHNQSKTQAFHGNLDTKSVRKAITLHPVKQPSYMYRLQVHFMSMRIQELQHQAIKLQRVLKNMDLLLNSTISSLSTEEKTSLQGVRDFHHQLSSRYHEPWDMFTAQKFYSEVTLQPPETGMRDPWKDGLNHVLGQTMGLINEEAKRVLHRSLEFKKLNPGYIRVHPLYGAQYLMDMLMKYHRHIGHNRRRMTVHVRHHAFLQLPFGNMVYRAESFGKEVPSVHFILPLTGRIGTFRRFMKNFEDVCLKRRENAKLLVVYFPSVTSAREHKTVMKDYQTRYPEADLLWLEAIGDFSRGLALSLGANQFDQSALLFFCDVDLVFNAEFLYRARTNTILGQQVYYPMVFSQFDPEITYPNRTAPNNQFTVNRDAGFWRAYAFGIVAVYNHDLRVVGGFDTTIQGWGLEDVDLYEKFVRHQDISVFRAADPGLVHVYHPVICDPKLVDRQYAMCQGSKASGFGSEKSLVRHMLSKGYINR
ncbi:chondroitin sulfate synthase 1-like [Stylophora pistillata]|uniref:Hexosyltransferase n=1 Tax=Stylophora pistillata TaxID=50429 RepID=A0A2B4S012_STYPI|nr:chondroitin sulfate synthase 1-like [Stylophora pistillata]PFX22746.1 Chondroitin sulfate synthase 1 [Stylophora pistillata]